MHLVRENKSHSHLPILSLSMLGPDNLSHTTISRPKSLQTGTDQEPKVVDSNVDDE